MNAFINDLFRKFSFSSVTYIYINTKQNFYMRTYFIIHTFVILPKATFMLRLHSTISTNSIELSSLC